MLPSKIGNQVIFPLAVWNISYLEANIHDSFTDQIYLAYPRCISGP